MRRKVKTVKKLSLDAVGREELEHAKGESSGRSSSTVFGGHEQVLRHTVIALREGSSLTEHNSPGEATIIVLSGHVRLTAGSNSWDGQKGDLLVIPPERHSLEALKDAVVVLTTAMVR
jgi:quercetin dioxygenase-like cupin family protein